MLRIFIICFGLLAMTAQSEAQDVPIQATITAQIEAFRADDFERAYSFASPTIHQIFGPTERFAAMVMTGYPMVVNPASVEMMDLREVAGTLWQRVRITDQKGQGWLLDYQMVEGPLGWLINAVQLQKAPDLGA